MKNSTLNKHMAQINANIAAIFVNIMFFTVFTFSHIIPSLRVIVVWNIPLTLMVWATVAVVVWVLFYRRSLREIGWG